MKKAIKAITGISCLLLLAMGALTELTTPAIIVSVVCLAWLSLVAFATERRQKQDNASNNATVPGSSRMGAGTAEHDRGI